MTIDSSKSKRRMATMLKQIAVAAAFGACSLAQAGILDFEGSAGDTPFLFEGDVLQVGAYWLEPHGGTQTGDFVGTLVDGSSNDLCMGLACPVNNSSNYYAALDDGYFYFGLNDDSPFKVRSLQASFIGAGQASFPATSGILQLQGFDANGSALGGVLQLGLAGPTAGMFNFGTYDLSHSLFGNTSFSFVRVLGYACDTSGNCNRTSDLSNFAVDNIVTVPEPTSWALFGLGLIGLGVFSRRRSA